VPGLPINTWAAGRRNPLAHTPLIDFVHHSPNQPPDPSATAPPRAPTCTLILYRVRRTRRHAAAPGLPPHQPPATRAGCV